MEFKETKGYCSKLNKECNFIAKYEKVKGTNDLKLMNMLNTDTDLYCHNPMACPEGRTCEIYSKMRKSTNDI